MLPSVAREFFEGIVGHTDPITKIRSLINQHDPVFETDWLEFKIEHPTDQKQRDVSARKYWSEYLSSFANTGGGVIVWGIEAKRKNVNGRVIDYASGVVPINDPIGLASKLNEWQGQATNPPLSGVEIRPFTLTEKPIEGFVVCYVPQGTLRPYQSLQTSDKQYYLRGGTSNFVMDRAVLASMFYPRSCVLFRARANLELTRSQRREGRPSSSEIACRMELFNDGTATAREIVGRIAFEMPGTLKDITPINGTCRSNRTEDYYKWDPTLHSGFDAVLFSALWRVDRSIVEHCINCGDDQEVAFHRIRLSLYCDNQAPQVITVSFRLRDLAEQGMLSIEATAE